MVLFGTTVLIPQFLQVLLGYTAERAGMVLSPGALVLMCTMPIAGRIVSGGKLDPRLLVAIGYGITAVGLFNLTRLDLNVTFGQITIVARLPGDGAVVHIYPDQHAELSGGSAEQEQSDFEFF